MADGNYVTFPIGSLRIRLPVAANIALQTAGAMGGVPGSPTPPGASLLGTMCTSTTRHLGNPQHRIVVEVTLRHASVLDRDRALQCRGKPEHDAALHLRFDRTRIHVHTAVDGADDAMHPHVSFRRD